MGRHVLCEYNPLNMSPKMDCRFVIPAVYFIYFTEKYSSWSSIYLINASLYGE
jgi:hypothetical protein